MTLWMAHRTHSPAETASPEQRYRVTNWTGCNRAFFSRAGGGTLWIDDAVLSGWRASAAALWRSCARLKLARCSRCHCARPGASRTSLKTLLGLTISVPHYTTLARRAAGLDVPQRIRACGPVHLAVCSTGLKVFGEGGWKPRLDGKHKRRVWVPRCIWRSTPQRAGSRRMS